jgi:DNA primase
VKKAGMSGFNDFIRDNSKDFVLFKTNLLLREAGTDPMRKTVLIKDLVETLAHIPEAIKRSAFITQCAHLMKIDEHILIRETNKAFNEFMRQRRQGIPRDIDIAESDIQRQVFDRESRNADASIISFPDLIDQYQERDIIRILLNYGDKEMPEANTSPLGKYIILSLMDVVDQFQHDIYKKIILDYKGQLEQGQIPTTEYYTNHADREIQSLAIELLTFPFEYASWEEHDIPFQIQLHPDENFKKDALNAILRLKLRMLMRQIEENQALIMRYEEEGNLEEMAIHLHMHNDLVKMREQITSQFKSVVLKV